MKTHAAVMTTLTAAYQAGRPFNTVTVTEIVANAGVSRATFYRRYQNLGDVLIVALMAVLHQFEQRVDARASIDFEQGTTIITALIREHGQLIRLLQWANQREAAEQLLTGEVLNVLTLRDHQAAHRQLIGACMGATLWAFASQIAALSPTPSLDEVRTLYQLLVSHQL
ncbi:TetR/AcrR family transcriptional regulator [Furfurilactobacillus sp. WILCCON 0119]